MGIVVSVRHQRRRFAVCCFFFILITSSAANYQSWNDPAPPPPPPPARNSRSEIHPADSKYNPIDYNFRSKTTARTTATTDNDNDEVQNGDDTATCSPRRDAVAVEFQRHATRARVSCAVVGAGVGAFLEKSLSIQKYHALIVVGALLFVALSLVRNAHGELVRALGVALLRVVQRSRQVRRNDPTWPHVKALFGAGPRQPLPMSLVPTIAIGFVGAACGAHVPLLPTWMAALAAGSVTIGVATLPNAKGDLVRCMGLRVVAVGTELVHVNEELQVLPKLGVVASQVLDKMLILDRKHRIHDRIVSGVTFVYEQVTKQASGGVDAKEDGRGYRYEGDEPRYDDRNDPRYDDRNEPRYDDRNEPRHDDRLEPRYDERNEPRYDERKERVPPYDRRLAHEEEGRRRRPLTEETRPERGGFF
jgi:hypothetical protein